jgi:hypothetical protein
MEAFNNFLHEVTSEINQRAGKPLVKNARLRSNRTLRVKLQNGQELNVKNVPAVNSTVLYAVTKYLNPDRLRQYARQLDPTPEVSAPVAQAPPAPQQFVPGLPTTQVAKPSVPTQSLIPGVPAAFNEDILKTAKYLVPILLVIFAGIYVFYYVVDGFLPEGEEFDEDFEEGDEEFEEGDEFATKQKQKQKKLIKSIKTLFGKKKQ